MLIHVHLRSINYFSPFMAESWALDISMCVGKLDMRNYLPFLEALKTCLSVDTHTHACPHAQHRLCPPYGVWTRATIVILLLVYIFYVNFSNHHSFGNCHFHYFFYLLLYFFFLLFFLVTSTELNRQIER